MDEFEFENSISPSQIEPVAIDNKHAYKTVVIKPSKLRPSPFEMVSKEEASPINVISDCTGAIEKVIPKHPSPTKNIDKINNLVQKEIALGRVGVTRDKAYRVIASALDAHKWMDIVDRQGNVKQEWVADLDKQRWGAEMAIKMFGDMIERKEIEHDIGDKTLDRFRSMSVAELKSRASDLLLGRKGAVEAEIIK